MSHVDSVGHTLTGQGGDLSATEHSRIVAAGPSNKISFVLDLGFKILDLGFKILDLGFKITAKAWNSSPSRCDFLAVDGWQIEREWRIVARDYLRLFAKLAQ